MFHEPFADPRVVDDVRVHGMTDRAIIRGGLERVGRACDEPAIDAICATYLAALADEMPRSEGFRVFPGVPALLDALAGRRRVAVGLGTGNLREGARLKLEHARLHHHFAFGGYGCDHEQRPEIIRIAAERGANHLGVPFAACRVVVIGDTPKDVEAAHAIGAASVAVETSGISPQTLKTAGATHVFPTLEHARVLDALLNDRA